MRSIIQWSLLFWVGVVGIFIRSSNLLPAEYTALMPQLIPTLMVFAGLVCRLGGLLSLASVLGVWVDTFSSNPLGTSIPVLLLVGLAARGLKDAVFLDLGIGRFAVGIGAGAVYHLGLLLLLKGMGESPLLGSTLAIALPCWVFGSGLLTFILYPAFFAVGELIARLEAPKACYRQDTGVDRGRY